MPQQIKNSHYYYTPREDPGPVDQVGVPYDQYGPPIHQ
jgi:hypothetical protein